MKSSNLRLPSLLLYILLFCLTCGLDGCKINDNGVHDITAKPGQPATGPGGSAYEYQDITKMTYQSNGVTNYIFQPSPMPDDSLPCIAFLHGYNLFGDPLPHYTGQINHLVKKGYVVLFVEFQPLTFTDTKTYESNAATIIKDGLAYIASHPATCVQTAKDSQGALQLGLIGFSVGGATAVNVVANYAANGIPKPKFLYTMEANNGGGNTSPMRDASTIPADVIVCMAIDEANGKNDKASFITSSTFWNQMNHIPAANKQWIGLYSDKHPNASALNLIADHLSPFSSEPDTHDFYGWYKWSTAVANYAFYGTDYKYWWGNTKEQTYLGTWSDGVDVRPALGTQVPFFPGE